MSLAGGALIRLSLITLSFLYLQWQMKLGRATPGPWPALHVSTYTSIQLKSKAEELYFIPNFTRKMCRTVQNSTEQSIQKVPHPERTPPIGIK